MPKVTVITVSAQERVALEKASQYGTTPSFRLRCQAVLLKTEKRTSVDVAKQLGCCEMSVNDWLKRYQEQGLAGLHVQKGRGRKAILQTDTDLATVRRAVQGSRQRLSLAKAELEQELGKTFGLLALKRFLKKPLPLQANTTSAKAEAQRRCLRSQARGSGRPGSPVHAGSD